MTKLLLLIGLPGSGKSYLAQQLAADSHQLLISTDGIRKILYGDESIQGSWGEIWWELERRFTNAVIRIQATEAAMAIYDATNAKRQYRRDAIALARNTGFTHITGLWVDTPLAQCQQRNQQRSRQVPTEIILQMDRQLKDAPPSLADGFDRLIRWSVDGGCTEIAIASVRKNRT